MIEDYEKKLSEEIDLIILQTYQGKILKDVNKYKKQIYEFIKNNISLLIIEKPSYLSTVVRTYYRILKKEHVSISGYTFIQRLCFTSNNEIAKKIETEYLKSQKIILEEGIKYNLTNIYEIINIIYNSREKISNELLEAINTIKHIDNFKLLESNEKLR